MVIVTTCVGLPASLSSSSRLNVGTDVFVTTAVVEVVPCVVLSVVVVDVDRDATVELGILLESVEEG